METWRTVLHVLLRIWNVKELSALAAALEADSPALLQGSTTEPAPVTALLDVPAAGACLICYPGWHLGHVSTTAEVVDYFEGMQLELDTQLGYPGASQPLTDWYDGTDRDTMRRELLAEVRRELRGRKPDPTTPPAAVARAA